MAKRANLILVGFMGSGKSSVGRVLASRLQFQFVDTDQLITQRAGCEITAIFEKQGEEAFRDLETETLRSMDTREHCVIATGGGIVVKERNHALLRSLGVVVCLKADPKVIFERVSRNTKRPLLQTANPKDTIMNLLAARQPLYEKVAEVTIDGSSLQHEQVADRVIDACRRIPDGPLSPL